MSDEEIKTVVKSAVDMLYRLLWQREYAPEKYRRNVEFGLRYTKHWDDPDAKSPMPGNH